MKCLLQLFTTGDCRLLFCTVNFRNSSWFIRRVGPHLTRAQLRCPHNLNFSSLVAFAIGIIHVRFFDKVKCLEEMISLMNPKTRGIIGTYTGKLAKAGSRRLDPYVVKNTDRDIRLRSTFTWPLQTLDRASC